MISPCSLPAGWINLSRKFFGMIPCRYMSPTKRRLGKSTSTLWASKNIYGPTIEKLILDSLSEVGEFMS